MNRLHFVEPEDAGETTQEIFKNLVLIPNILCVIANSDAATAAFTDMNKHLKTCKLSEKHRKMVSLAVSQFNHCDYCISLHTTTAIEAGLLTPDDYIQVRKFESGDPKDLLILKFTKQVLKHQGRLDDENVMGFKAEGIDDQEMVEIIAVISFIQMANYTANLARPEMDFPEAPSI